MSGDRSLLRPAAYLYALAVPVLALVLPWPFPALAGTVAAVLWVMSRKPRRVPPRRPEPLPRRFPASPAEIAALNGDADLKRTVWATMAPEDAPSRPRPAWGTALYGRHLERP